MADTKITALAAITTVDPAADVLPIVDISDTSMAASGTTKKITSNQILGAGGTATLASATITGALTVQGNGPHRFGTSNYSQFDQSSLQFVGSRATPGTLSIYGNTNRLIFQADTGGYLFQNAANTLTLLSIANDATQVTLNASGLGVGISPQTGYRASLSGSLAIVTAGANFTIEPSAASGANGTDLKTSFSAGGNGPMKFWIGATQAMTLDASGNLLLGKTAVSDLTVGFQATQSGVVGSTRASSSDTESTYFVYSTGAAAYRFYVGMGGTVYATNTTISGISDARFKENVQDIDVGLGAILALKPRKFDWKEGKGKNIKGDRGFIAQEFEQVFPNLVDEWKDEAPEGEAPYKSVRQDLIPVLVKAIQELTARVQTLEAK